MQQACEAGLAGQDRAGGAGKHRQGKAGNRQREDARQAARRRSGKEQHAETSRPSPRARRGQQQDGAMRPAGQAAFTERLGRKGFTTGESTARSAVTGRGRVFPLPVQTDCIGASRGRRMPNGRSEQHDRRGERSARLQRGTTPALMIARFSFDSPSLRAKTLSGNHPDWSASFEPLRTRSAQSCQAVQ
jgi:hypothetical protein